MTALGAPTPRSLSERFAETNNVRDFGAVGDGVTDDAPAIQAAINALYAARGGTLYFPAGVYRIGSLQSTWTALILDFTGAITNTKPVNIVGEGATLRHDTDDTKALLALGGRPGASPDDTVASFNLRGVTVRGLTFVGTRSGTSDTDITGFGNTLLYLTDVENVRVTDCEFRNCNGAGVYYFVRKGIFSGNVFWNTNGGIQGDVSREVLVSNNTFRCDVKCDDQMGIFASRAGSQSKGIAFIGNVLNKGFDGTYGSVGGTKRGWARCLIVADNTDGVTISGNVFADNGSSHMDDTSAAEALHHIKFEPTSGNGNPQNISITNNVFRNARNGIRSTAVLRNVIITGNSFRQLANPINLSAQSGVESNGNVLITGNVFEDATGTPIITVGNAFGLQVTGNQLRGVGSGQIQASSVGGYGPGNILIHDNPGYSLNVLTPTFGANVAIDNRAALRFTVTATSNIAFQIDNPSASNPVVGTRLRITLRNSTAGALGALAWGTAYKVGTWTQPATGTSRTIDVEWNGTNWVECSRTPVDVPN